MNTRATMRMFRMPMVRISLSYIFEFANKVEPLSAIPTDESPIVDVFIPLIIAEGAIRELYNQTLYAPYLRSSSASAHLLQSAIQAQTAQSDMARKVDAFSLLQIKNLYGQFKTTLIAELGVLHSYFISQQGGFDTVSLLAFGENLFPADLSTKVPEAIFDVREAGRCMAYDVPTAAGFHIFRATESVLRKYYAQVTNGAAHPKVRSLGVYLAALNRAKKGDPKILAALAQMTVLHRNPLIHPEAVLTLDEAIATFGIARSAMTAMLAELSATPPTTATPLPISSAFGA